MLTLELSLADIKESSLLFMISPVIWFRRNIISYDESPLALILEFKEDTALFSWVVFRGFSEGTILIISFSSS